MTSDGRLDLNAMLREVNLTTCEYNVLTTLYYDTCKFKHLIQRAVAEDSRSEGVDESGLKSLRNEARRAINNLMERGLIWVIDDEKIDAIVAHLNEHPSYGPLEGLPNRRFVDFTMTGGATWERLQQLMKFPMKMAYNFSTFTDYTMTVKCCNENRDELLRFVELESHVEGADGYAPRQVLYRDGPREIGAWRSRWWQKCSPKGFVFEGCYQIRQ